MQNNQPRKTKFSFDFLEDLNTTHDTVLYQHRVTIGERDKTEHFPIDKDDQRTTRDQGKVLSDRGSEIFHEQRNDDIPHASQYRTWDSPEGENKICHEQRDDDIPQVSQYRTSHSPEGGNTTCHEQRADDILQASRYMYQFSNAVEGGDSTCHGNRDDDIPQASRYRTSIVEEGVDKTCLYHDHKVDKILSTTLNQAKVNKEGHMDDALTDENIQLSSRFQAVVAINQEIEAGKVQEDVVGMNQHSGIPNNKASSSPVADVAVHGEIGRFSIKYTHRANTFVYGILVLSQKIIIADSDNAKLQLFDLNGKHLSDVGSRQYITGITKFDKNHFVTGGSDGLIHFWKLCGNDIKCLDKTFHEESKIFGICYNGTFFGVLHHTDDLINVLDSQGRKVRKIVLNEAFGKKIKFGFDIHMDIATHNIYVPCVNHTYGVLCMSVEGEPLWFSPLIGIPRGITEAHGVLCVANNTKKCMHLISKNGEHKGKLMDDIVGYPECVYYDNDGNKLYFNLCWYNRDVICFVPLKHNKQ